MCRTATVKYFWAHAWVTVRTDGRTKSFLPASCRSYKHWLTFAKCRFHTCSAASFQTLKHKSELFISSLAKLILQASPPPFIPFAPRPVRLSSWNSTPKTTKLRSAYLRKHRRSQSLWVNVECSLVHLWHEIRKVYRTQSGGLTWGWFVFCVPHVSCSPTGPSFPSAKIGPTLSGSCGVPAWVMEPQTSYQASFSLWQRARKLLYRGSHNGKWNHCPRRHKEPIYFGRYCF